VIIKFFELDKLKKENYNYFLLYGENQGLKNELIKDYFLKNFKDNSYKYDEKEILDNLENFFNNILSQSFFEKEKLIVVERVTDKILDVIEEIVERKISDLKIVFNADILDKKSKLRSFFEKDKNTVCIPFYADNNQTLTGIVGNFFRQNNIPISQQSLNLLVERAKGDRKNLKSELEKIKNFLNGRKKIEIEDLIKLTNLAENYDVSELIDNCLAKNKRKTINILNENNYTLDDCIIIIRTLLIKSKKLLKLCKQFQIEKNIDLVISSCKPPIFWKDKEITKQQIKNWTYTNIENLIYKISEIELLIKKNSNNSINILSDFIIEQVTVTSN
tara:strand:- start:587 stop:1582 length:996 start_codon:yes stop_codon:yes gene_type:complete